MLEIEEIPRDARQKPGETRKRKAIKRGKQDAKDPSQAVTSTYYYIMVHNEEVSLWNTRVFNDGSHLFQEMVFDQYGITEDDLRHAIRLGEKDYMDSIRNRDPVYYPISPHIETKLKILNPI